MLRRAARRVRAGSLLFVLACALAAGCIFALDSDAHAHPELEFADIAIAHARLAAIPQDRIVNYWGEKKFLKWARGAWER